MQSDKMENYRKSRILASTPITSAILLLLVCTAFSFPVITQAQLTGNNTANATTTTNTTANATTTNTTANATTSAATSTPGGAATTTVSMAQGSQSQDNPEFYVPPEVSVKSGETITWKNDDTAIHTATSGKDATPDGKFDTSLVSPGQSSKPIAMPNEPGQYSYFCTLHPWMIGTVTVG